MWTSMAAAKKTRTEYNTVTTQAARILQNIASEPDWAWAKPAVNHEDLQIAKAVVDDTVQNIFCFYAKVLRKIHEFTCFYF